MFWMSEVSYPDQGGTGMAKIAYRGQFFEGQHPSPNDACFDPKRYFFPDEVMFSETSQCHIMLALGNI
jgi:hypothetical protein